MAWASGRTSTPYVVTMLAAQSDLLDPMSEVDTRQVPPSKVGGQPSTWVTPSWNGLGSVRHAHGSTAILRRIQLHVGRPYRPRVHLVRTL